MSYSRWSNSYWYTYWYATDLKYSLPTRGLKNEQIFQICDSPSFDFSYGELQEVGIGYIISRVESHFRKIHPNKPPTEEDLRELMDYIKEWENDVDGHFKFSTFIWFEWYLPIRNKLNKLWKKR